MHGSLTKLAALCWVLVIGLDVHGDDPQTNDLVSTSTTPQIDTNGSFDPDASSALSYRVSDELSLGAKANIELQAEDNFDLDRTESDTLLVLNPKFSLAAMYVPAGKVEIFGEVRVEHLNPLQDTADDEDVDSTLEFREGYILIEDFLGDGLSLQLGRQRIKDSREWFFDERLDAARVKYEKDDWSLEISASSMLLDPDGIEDEINNYVIRSRHQYSKDGRVTFYGIARQDHSPDDRDPVYLGISWKDRPHKRHKFWFDGAYLFGKDGDHNLSSGGFDVGWTHRIKHDLRPTITFAFAYGSGDSDPDRGTDHAFQQTDLQDNNAKFWGITKFKYYGEVFDPELSNMMIFTTGLGLVPSEKTISADLVYHYYRLIELTDELRDAGVEEDLNGDHRDLGHEIDLIIGVRPENNINASISTGVFFPGRAYDDDQVSFGAEFNFQISF